MSLRYFNWTLTIWHLKMKSFISQFVYGILEFTKNALVQLSCEYNPKITIILYWRLSNNLYTIYGIALPTCTVCECERNYCIKVSFRSTLCHRHNFTNGLNSLAFRGSLQWNSLSSALKKLDGWMTVAKKIAKNN